VIADERATRRGTLDQTSLKLRPPSFDILEQYGYDLSGKMGDILAQDRRIDV